MSGLVYWMQALMNSKQNKADHLLYRVYFKLMIPDILYKLGFESTKDNKRILHDFHKRVLGYKSIAGVSDESIGHFLRDVGVFWAERGIFVRTRRNQPVGIELMSFSDVIMVDGKSKRVWDLL